MVSKSSDEEWLLGKEKLLTAVGILSWHSSYHCKAFLSSLIV